MALQVEWKLIIASFGTGLLASCVIVWNFLFNALFSFEAYTNWQSILYVWSLPGIQLISVFCTVKVNYKNLYWLCIFNQAVAFVCFLCWSLNWRPGISMPVLYVINLFTLIIWLFVSYNVIYLCPEIYHKYFELGFFLSLVFHYCLTQFELYLTTIMFIPFFVYMSMGYLAFLYVQSHDLFLAGKARCKPIFFTSSQKYIVYTAWQVLNAIGPQLFLLWCLNTAIIAICVPLNMFTNAFLSLYNYIFIFYVGNFCCGSLMIKRGHVMALVYAVVIGSIATVLFVAKDSLSGEVMVSLLALLFIFYFHANACIHFVIRNKLSRNITTPRLILNLCFLSNATLEIALLIANKFL
ncbi:ORF58 [Bovine gammaherpesvirus 6]|uniref:ORF58 n=1 Tax=Bovine gammaherpesvirus 6 TaxID=1504288 RepID=A0A060CXN8_9GAMA|nr:ORF58 [Bovine gammaherpesvirus 6]AIB03213.1 ORF58 [Bovine gammaherpesvirus 6]